MKSFAGTFAKAPDSARERRETVGEYTQGMSVLNGRAVRSEGSRRGVAEAPEPRLFLLRTVL